MIVSNGNRFMIGDEEEVIYLALLTESLSVDWIRKYEGFSLRESRVTAVGSELLCLFFGLGTMDVVKLNQSTGLVS